MQLWQEQGEAKLNSQSLYCISAEGSQLPLFRMNISQCGERAAPLPESPESRVLALPPTLAHPLTLPWAQTWLPAFLLGHACAASASPVGAARQPGPEGYVSRAAAGPPVSGASLGLLGKQVPGPHTDTRHRDVWVGSQKRESLADPPGRSEQSTVLRTSSPKWKLLFDVLLEPYPQVAASPDPQVRALEESPLQGPKF